MIAQTVKKALKNNPYIIFPYGKIGRKKLKNRLKKSDYQFPDELVKFWEEFGGGELFEVETFLHPLETDNELIDDLWQTNEFYHNQGLDQRYIIFQKNAAQLAVFDTETNEVVLLSNADYQVRQKFDDINKWFTHLWQAYQ